MKDNNRPPNVDDLSPACIHVWRIELPVASAQFAKSPHMLGTLSAEERSTSQRFTQRRDQEHFKATHAALRQILGCYVGRAPGDVQFCRTDAGKPKLADPSSGIHFNLAHSGDWALTAVARSPVGVDVEQARPIARLDALVRRICTVAEQREIFALEGASQLAAFRRCWTGKEAVLKGIGRGLRGAAAEVDVLQSRTGEESTATLPRRMNHGVWHIRWFAVDTRHTAAVATQLSAPQVIHSAWPIKQKFGQLN